MMCFNSLSSIGFGKGSGVLTLITSLITSFGLGVSGTGTGAGVGGSSAFFSSNLTLAIVFFL